MSRPTVRARSAICPTGSCIPFGVVWVQGFGLALAEPTSDTGLGFWSWAILQVLDLGGQGEHRRAVARSASMWACSQGLGRGRWHSRAHQAAFAMAGLPRTWSGRLSGAGRSSALRLLIAAAQLAMAPWRATSSTRRPLRSPSLPRMARILSGKCLAGGADGADGVGLAAVSGRPARVIDLDHQLAVDVEEPGEPIP